jgi:hypothetical protein
LTIHLENAIDKVIGIYSKVIDTSSIARLKLKSNQNNLTKAESMNKLQIDTLIGDESDYEVSVCFDMFYNFIKIKA